MKYRFLMNDQIMVEHEGRKITLTRIQALNRAYVGDKVVEQFALGGYIEKSLNLEGCVGVAHSNDEPYRDDFRFRASDAWVDEGAYVFDNARVFKGAYVKDAWVANDARVFAKAKIIGHGIIGGKTKVCGRITIEISNGGVFRATNNTLIYGSGNIMVSRDEFNVNDLRSLYVSNGAMITVSGRGMGRDINNILDVYDMSGVNASALTEYDLDSDVNDMRGVVLGPDYGKKMPGRNVLLSNGFVIKSPL